MDFRGDIGYWQRRIGDCPEGISRRLAVLDALSASQSSVALDVGCGGGHLVRELALTVGSSGRAVGIDISDDQLAAARALCADMPCAEFMNADVCNLAFEDATFECVSSIQTLEYVPHVELALREIRRVMKRGGQVAFVSVLWDAFRFHGAEDDLTSRIIKAWQAHCPFQMLPAEIPRMMSRVGLEGVSQRPLAFFNGSMNENCYAHWAAKVVAVFSTSQGVSETDAQEWLEQLEKADRDGRFGFVSVPVLTAGTAV